MASLSTGLPSRDHDQCLLESMYHRASHFAGRPRKQCHMASDIFRLPCILQCVLSLGLPLCRASYVHTIRPPAETAYFMST